jgi:hypothetical protein
MNRAAAIAAALLGSLTTSAVAQDVQRCEAPDGKVSYANGPCPAGSRPVRTLPPAAKSNAADQQAAQQRSRQDASKLAIIEGKRKAEDLRAAREQEQARNKAKKEETHCRRLETRVRHAREDFAVATLKKRPEAQRRLKRAEELYAEDCGKAPK